jgi:PAS domain S-box-containing protein
VTLIPLIRVWRATRMNFGERMKLRRQQARMVKVGAKSSEHRTAEAAVAGFRKNLGPFVVAAETSRMPMAFTDAQAGGHPIIFANDSFLQLTGYEREEILGRYFSCLVAGGTDPAMLAEVDRAFHTDSGGASVERYVRKNGSEFYAAKLVSPVRNENGTVVQYFVSLIDLTEHNRDQQRARMLIDELNHRVRNTLAIVQSIVGHALRDASGPEQIRDAIESRLLALARSHDMLTREDWRGVGLLDLVHEALEPFGAAKIHTRRFTISGVNIRLSPKATLLLSIVLHELATNALKHGALSSQAGSVLIQWRIERGAQGNARLLLSWKEKDGPRVSQPARKGFGSQVIEQGIAYELDGTVTLRYCADGLLCTIEVNAPDAADG